MRGYDGALRYLFSLERFGTVFGLENIRWILGLLNNPHRAFPVIHVAGTNGKGSVSAMASAMLREAGYSVGTYTSPHLVSFTERITINEAPIGEDRVAAMTEQIRMAVEDADRDHFFTFFDFTTAMAFQHFQERGVDVAVIEVGMGGRLDSTNVVDPLVSIIVNVGKDHAEYLGESLSEIALEKAGVIKKGVPVVTAAQYEALTVIENQAAKLHSPLYRLGKEFHFRKRGPHKMSYEGPRFRIPDLSVSLPGDHQLANASVALCATEILPQGLLAVSHDSALKSLAGVVWPGRLEILGTTPPVLLDGAHNVEGMQSLRQYLESYHGMKRKILIFASMKDKDYPGMIREIAPHVDRVILTAPDMDRAAPPNLIAPFIRNHDIAATIPEALHLAKSLANDDNLIVVAGSLFLVGEVKRHIDEIF
jgi:dihydrofolate synthase / folylpolyglutamate synthase